MRGWTDIGSDVCWEDHGGNWAKKGADGTWYVIHFDNMKEHGIHDWPQYYAQVRNIDPSSVSEEELNFALKCIGLSKDEIDSEYEIVFAFNSYGLFAPLDEFWGKSYPERVRASARRKAEEYMKDSEALEDSLDRMVNAIGNTARDFRAGNIGLRAKNI